jgi:hypothetical protein
VELSGLKPINTVLINISLKLIEILCKNRIMFMILCVLCINYYNCCYGNVVKEFSALWDVYGYVCVFCINHYSRCHGNDVKGFSALWFALLTMKPLSSTCGLQLSWSTVLCSVCVVLDGYCCKT